MNLKQNIYQQVQQKFYFSQNARFSQKTGLRHYSEKIAITFTRIQQYRSMTSELLGIPVPTLSLSTDTNKLT